MTKVTVNEPARLDIVCGALMGKTGDGAFEAFLAANPGLAAEGPFLVAPRAVTVPPTPEPTPVAAVNPWD